MRLHYIISLHETDHWKLPCPAQRNFVSSKLHSMGFICSNVPTYFTEGLCCGFTCSQWAVGSEWETCRVLSSALCSPAVPHSCRSRQVGLQSDIFIKWGKKNSKMDVYNQLPYQYKTSSPHSTSNLKWEKATGAESPSRASRYQALSSFISSLFSLSFHPHSLCSYLQQNQKQSVSGNIQFFPALQNRRLFILLIVTLRRPLLWQLFNCENRWDLTVSACWLWWVQRPTPQTAGWEKSLSCTLSASSAWGGGQEERVRNTGSDCFRARAGTKEDSRSSCWLNRVSCIF